MTEIFQATIHHQGQTYTIDVPADRSLLDAAHDRGLDLPCSCYTGVCTTCAAQLVRGEVDQSQGMGMGAELDAKGYILLCVACPRSDVEIVTEKEAEVYALRFGRIE
ncbi:MAG: 2Fe-2S iron-sulfur cluster binding domain-containing protein [Cyanobacteria bacterium KgW148]|nr:2Fe-2S iron-sulfur cluster binding domain-containing protein [Cyanobacteria bacterium KgW148]